MRKVPLSLLTSDMVLARPVYHLNSLLLKVGTTGLERYRTSLSRLGVMDLYVEDRLGADIIIEDTVEQGTRLRCKEVLFTTLNRMSSYGVLDLSGLSENADQMLEEILNSPDIAISMNEIGTSDDSTFNHSINVAIYGMLLAKELDYPRARTKKLAMGLLLHDIGKILVNQAILYKKGRLTPEEFDHIKSHTTLGYQVLRKTDSLTELSRIIALSHHERMDGSGYPYHLKQDEIHEFVRISAIVDVYDALISERCYHTKRSTYEAVKLLQNDSAGKLDTDLLSLFIRKLAIYPNGSLVKLSDQTLGIVKQQNISMPYRPVIRIIRDEKGRPTPLYDVDLSRELDKKIIEAEYNSEQLK